MTNKMLRTLQASEKYADYYVEKNRRYLAHEYCMSEDQLSRVRSAFQQGFLAGAAFK